MTSSGRSSDAARAAVVLGCIAILAALFAVAGVAKLADGKALGETITLVDRCSLRFQYCKPLLASLELLTAMLLLSYRATRTGLLLSILMLGLFNGVLLRESWSANPLPCGCLGGGEMTHPQAIAASLRWAIVRNSGLIVAAGVALWCMESRRQM